MQQFRINGVVFLLAAVMVYGTIPFAGMVYADENQQEAKGLSDSQNPKEKGVMDLAQEDEVLSATGFTYDPKGRRDPFLSVWNKGAEGTRPPGIAGMEISELDLMGIAATPDGKNRYALVLGTDNKGYNLREGDQLYDGKVKKIESDRVTFLKKVNDPLSIREYTEIVKRLNPEGD